MNLEPTPVYSPTSKTPKNRQGFGATTLWMQITEEKDFSTKTGLFSLTQFSVMVFGPFWLKFCVEVDGIMLFRQCPNGFLITVTVSVPQLFKVDILKMRKIKDYFSSISPIQLPNFVISMIPLDSACLPAPPLCVLKVVL